MRLARLLAFLLDVLLCAVAADLAGLVLTALIWRFFPAATAAIAWIWAALALGAMLAFLLRDSGGGRARRWLGFEVQRADGRAPGPWGSIRRNLPLFIPGWNLFDAWPLLSNGAGPRRCDTRSGTCMLRIT